MVRQVQDAAGAAWQSLTRFFVNEQLTEQQVAELLSGLAAVRDCLKLEGIANPNVTPEKTVEELLATLFSEEQSGCGASAETREPEDKRNTATGLRTIDHFANFMRMLAPPPRGAQNETTRLGESVFDQIGCAACHLPEIKTGSGQDARAPRLYSDLLLHDIGTGFPAPIRHSSRRSGRTRRCAWK